MKIVIDKNTPTKEFRHHWKFCVGSAHATYALRHDYTVQLAKVREELGIERVRFHGIFGDDMHTLTRTTDILPIPFGRSYVERTFRQCAAAYDNILSAGMKPFVELSFMPKKLAMFGFAKGFFFYKPIVSLPRCMKKWQEYIGEFVRFLIDRYGKEEVESWFFEVWNEPDLPVIFFDGTQKDYFKLYAATARAIKAVDNKIRVGGPATSGNKWVEEFIAYCSAEGVPVDFISTHQYAGDPLGGVEDDGKGVSLKIDMLAALRGKGTLDRSSILGLYRAFMGVGDAPKTLRRDTFIDSAQRVKKLVGELPLYYTEWNMCANFSAPCNDTSMQAAYDLHVILNSDDSIDGSSIWCFSDLFEEFHQFPEEFHGGFGLMTQSGIKKPAYHALRFLNEAGGTAYEIPHGDSVDAAVFKKENETHIILSMLDFDAKDGREQINISLESDEPSAVTVSKIDADHANPLRVWERMGRPQVPNRSQLSEIEEESAPREEALPFEYRDGRILLNTDIGANEIRRIIIRR